MIAAARKGRGLAASPFALLVLALGASAQNAEVQGAVVPRWSGRTTPEHVEIARALRESRLPNATPDSILVDRIVRTGPGALDAEIEILARACVPEVAPGDRPQILSRPQRDLLLAAVARMPVSAVRTTLQAHLADGPGDVQSTLATILVLGTIGEARDLSRIVHLAPRGGVGEKALVPEAREALRTACGSILRRDARAWPALVELLRQTDAFIGGPLLEAVGSSRDPRGLEVLYAAAQVQLDLRPQIAALSCSCGASTDATVNREFAAWLVSELPSARPEYARSLIQALGVLDDGTCVPFLIARLSDRDRGVRDSALWALRRLSGLAFPAEPTAWIVWNRGEVDWHTKERPKIRMDLASGDPQLVVAALRAYGEHRTKRAELAADVARVLSNSRPELRRLACGVLQTLGASSASGALATALQDSDPGVSEAAWKALVAITGLDLPRDAKRVREILLIS